jgi:hypothetical protein
MEYQPLLDAIAKADDSYSRPANSESIASVLNKINNFKIENKDKETITQITSDIYDAIHNPFINMNPERRKEKQIARRPLYRALLLKYYSESGLGAEATQILQNFLIGTFIKREQNQKKQQQIAANLAKQQADTEALLNLVLKGGKRKPRQTKQKKVRKTKKTRRCPCGI